MILNYESYKNSVYGCWLGKNIGGTLGAPFEGKRQINDVTFYTQDLNGNPPPNDDLDLQLVWLNAIEKYGRAVNSAILGEYWLFFIIPLWGEYGVCKTNMSRGMLPPLSGSYNNSYGQSNGCFIRSEIWACISPGLPDVAARYAIEDGMVDHHSEGVYAEAFCAALESAAFVEKDVFKIIDIALSYMPENSDVAKAVNCAVTAYKSHKTWQKAREELMTCVPGTFGIQTTKIKDIKDNFPIGEAGYDAPSSIGIVVLSLLYGQNDFGKTICIATNCGEDADCTCATVGAIWGILHGGDSIPEKWSAPLQDLISTCCINLPVGGLDIPETVTELTDRILRLTPLFLGRKYCNILSDKNYTIEIPDEEKLFCPDETLYLPGVGFGNDDVPNVRTLLKRSGNCVTFRFITFNCCLEYLDGPTFVKGEKKHIKLTFTDSANLHGGNNQWLKLRWYKDEKIKISPETETSFLVKVTYQAKQVLEYEVSTENANGDFDIIGDISVDGHPTYGLIKVSFISSTKGEK